MAPSSLQKMSTLTATDTPSEPDWDTKAKELFKTKTIDQIKQSQRENKHAIESKNEELRLLVGDRYRDLIDAADTIVNMASSAAEVLSSVHNMKQVCMQIQHGSEQFGQTDYNRGAPNPTYSLALQMKLLMDAPEQIWSALEERNFTRAAKTYLLAHNTFTRLKLDTNARTSSTARALQSFPILLRQWDSIHPFKDTILREARAFVRHATGAARVVDALTAVIILERSSVRAVFDEYLAARADAVTEILTAESAGTGADNDTSAMVTFKDRITRVARHLVTTIKDAHFVFDDALPAEENPPDVHDAAENADEKLLEDMATKLTGGVDAQREAVEELQPGKIFAFLQHVLATPFAQVDANTNAMLISMMLPTMHGGVRNSCCFWVPIVHLCRSVSLTVPQRCALSCQMCLGVHTLGLKVL
eukprot:m.918318 g.918318  ORF g.918318 m.918318 type:complete len:419 (+) comp23744_c1_seq1:309-1565(+)